MRLMSFALTTQQIRDRTKTETRRVGWTFLKPGDRLRAVTKAMGLKKGEKPQDLAVIEVVSVKREPLSAITPAAVVREGFPDWTPAEFVAFYLEHSPRRSMSPRKPVTVIRFRYLEVQQQFAEAA